MLDHFAWTVGAARIQALPDVITGLVVAMTHFSRPGLAVIVPTPAYMPFLTVPAMHGRIAIEVPLAKNGGRAVLDLAAIERELAGGAGLVALCNPLNPGGRVFDGARHVPYASVSAAASGHSITVTSASKAWTLPGLKAAQLVLTNDADAELWSALGPFSSHGASTRGVIANTVAYRAGRDWLDATVEYYDANRWLLGELLAERLPEVGCTPPEGTYIAWLNVSRLGLGDEPAVTLQKRAKLSFTDGRACSAVGVGHVRMILATPRPIIEQIVDRIIAAVRSRRPAAVHA